MTDQHSDTEQRIVICNTTPEGRDFTSDSLFSLCISQTASCMCGTAKEERLRGGGFYIEVNAGISGRVLSIDPLCERGGCMIRHARCVAKSRRPRVESETKF